jgi:hypothetical protein
LDGSSTGSDWHRSELVLKSLRPIDKLRTGLSQTDMELIFSEYIVSRWVHLYWAWRSIEVNWIDWNKFFKLNKPVLSKDEASKC